MSAILKFWIEKPTLRASAKAVRTAVLVGPSGRLWS